MKIALFITCLTDNFYPRAGIAIVKVLEHLGHEVEFPKAQTCCGQPMFNNGFTGGARRVAEHMLDVFAPFETIVTPSASCAAMIREHYAHLFPPGSTSHQRAAALAARTYEFSEFLTRILKFDPSAAGVHWPGDATYHRSCHLRGLGLDHVAEELLARVPGMSLRQLKSPEQCCGFGGTFASKYPDISGGMVRDKVADIRQTNCPTVVCNEAGCAMNIEGACRRAPSPNPRFTSLAEVLAEGLGLLPRESGQ